MPKSSKKRKNGRVKGGSLRDSAGHVISSRSKRAMRDAGRRIMFRGSLIYQASTSLTAAEVEQILKEAKERRDSEEKVKPPAPIMTYITTVLDDNNIPIDGETKTLRISNTDIPRLESVLQQKLHMEQQMKENVEKQSSK